MLWRNENEGTALKYLKSNRMNTIKEFIESGILELYVLGDASPEEIAEVEKLALSHPAIQNEIDQISKTLEVYAEANAIEAPPLVKSFLLATIDYSERIKNGEPVSTPPPLNKNSRIEDYTPWLNRADMVLPPDAEEIFARIIGYSPQVISAVLWLKEGTPDEIHEHEYERFFIIEGTCNITVGEDVHQLVPGDYFEIPLYLTHSVKVTSSIPCKVILNRVAA